MDTETTTMSDRLRRYVQAIGEPTRGAILLELDRAGEMTATQISRRLNLSPTNAYHHMRVLLELGVVDPPRIAPGDTYVEKFYQINPELRAALRLNPFWYGETGEGMAADERQAAMAGVCLRMAHVLRRAAQKIQQMTPEEADRYFNEDQLFMLSAGRISREELKGRLAGIRRGLHETDLSAAEDTGARTDYLIIAALPSLAEEEPES